MAIVYPLLYTKARNIIDKKNLRPVVYARAERDGGTMHRRGGPNVAIAFGPGGPLTAQLCARGGKSGGTSFGVGGGGGGGGGGGPSKA